MIRRSIMKLTALNSIHRKLGAQLANAAGWEMAASYGDPLAEHMTVRNACGITDFSSMGPIDVKGPDAPRFLNYLTVNEVDRVPRGRVVYTTMLKEDGKVLDDTTVYKLWPDHYMVVTSTAKHDLTFQWMKEHTPGYAVYLTDMASALTLICLQGPHSRTILSKLTDTDLMALKYFCAAQGQVAGVPTIISRTGFTGELGYELYIPSNRAVEVWDALMEAGKDHGIAPVGTKACSATLRLEKAYMGGAELGDVYPIELPLAWTVKFNKGSFIGKEALLKVKEQGITRRLVGLVSEDELPAIGVDISASGKTVGKITSAGYGPTVKKNIALGFVASGLDKPGQHLQTQGTDGEKLDVAVVSIPFYDPEGTRVRA
jgi:aminomethyltransferase